MVFLHISIYLGTHQFLEEPSLWDLNCLTPAVQVQSPNHWTPRKFPRTVSYTPPRKIIFCQLICNTRLLNLKLFMNIDRARLAFRFRFLSYLASFSCLFVPFKAAFCFGVAS